MVLLCFGGGLLGGEDRLVEVVLETSRRLEPTDERLGGRGSHLVADAVLRLDFPLSQWLDTFRGTAGPCAMTWQGPQVKAFLLHVCSRLLFLVAWERLASSGWVFQDGDLLVYFKVAGGHYLVEHDT